MALRHELYQPLVGGLRLGLVGGDGIFVPALARIVVSAADIVATKIDDSRLWSDGGAARAGGITQIASWYTETLNTATRGETKAYPAVALGVVRTGTPVLTIYDMADTDTPMWMVFNDAADNVFATATATACWAENGRWYVAADIGLIEIDFINDTVKKWTNAGVLTYASTIDDRNGASGYGAAAGTGIVNIACNDVAATVLPGTPLDGTTGLPTPTVAVATAGGTSVIQAGGSVYDSSSVTSIAAVSWDNDGNLVYETQSGRGNLAHASHIFADGFGAIQLPDPADAVPIGVSTGTVASIASLVSKCWAFGNPAGLLLSHSALPDDANQFDFRRKTLHANITATYNTGWMFGDEDLCFAETSTTDSTTTLTNRAPAGGNDATVTGTVELNAANGGELSVYDGFSATDYATVANAAALNYGTSAAHFGTWINTADSATARTILSHGAAAGAHGWHLYLTAAGVAEAVVGSATVTGTTEIDDGSFHHLFVTTDGTTVRLYVDGSEEDNAAFAGTMTVASSITRIGLTATAADQAFPGIIGSLIHIGLNSPTAAQVAAKYAGELVMYGTGANCALSNAAVTAVAWDAQNEKLAVAAGAGVEVRSSSGLIRDSLTDSSGVPTVDAHTAVSYVNGALAMANGAEAHVDVPARTIISPAAAPYNENSVTYEAVTTDATPVDLHKLLIQDGDDRTFTGTLAAVNYDDSSQTSSYTIGSVTPGVISRTGATTTLDTSPDIIESESGLTTALTVAADDTAETLDDTGTGEAGKTIVWTGTRTLTDT